RVASFGENLSSDLVGRSAANLRTQAVAESGGGPPHCKTFVKRDWFPEHFARSALEGARTSASLSNAAKLTSRSPAKPRRHNLQVPRADLRLFLFGPAKSDPAECRSAAGGQTFSSASAGAAIAVVRCRSGDRRSRAGRCQLCARRFSDDRACGLMTVRCEPVAQVIARDRLHNQIQQLRLKISRLPVRNPPVRSRKSPKREWAVVPHQAR